MDKVKKIYRNIQRQTQVCQPRVIALKDKEDKIMAEENKSI